MILSNQVRCNRCGDEPFSAGRHSFVTCKCGNIAVDGGMDYLRRVGNVHGGYTNMSIEIPNEVGEAALFAIATVRDVNQMDMARESVTRVLQRAGIILEVPEEAKVAAALAVHWCEETGRNDLGVLCAIARAYRDAGVEFKQVTNG